MSELELRLKQGRLLRSQGRLEAAELEFRQALRLAPRHPAGLVAMAELAQQRGDTESAIGYYQDAVAARPNDLGLHAALRGLLIEQARFDWKADVAKAVAILKRPQAPAEARLGACNLLLQYGVTQGLDAELAALAERFPHAADLRRSARQLERSGLSRPLPQTDAPGDPEQEALILSFGVTEKPVAGAETLVLVFGGANHRLGLSFDIIHRILRPAGVSAIYLRDLERSWYLGGIVGLGASFTEAVAGLRDAVRRLGARRVVAIANCLGCAGALRYGLALGAEAVLGLAPRLRVPEHAVAGAAARAEVERLRGGEPLLAADVRAAYAAAPSAPALNLIYGADCAEDAADVHHMEGLPGVRGTAIAGYAGHACLNLLLGRGLLTPLLLGFVRSGGVDAELLPAIAGAAQERAP